MVKHNSYFRVLGYDFKKVTIDDMSSMCKDLKTITNDAEAVTAFLYENYGNIRFFYYDTSRELTELVHEGGKFKEFAFPRKCGDGK